MEIDPKKLRFVNNLALTTLGILMLLGAGLVWGAFTETAQIVKYSEILSIDDSGITETKAPYKGEGKALFQNNCQRCHLLDRPMTGPALANVTDRWSDSTNLYHWIKNSQSFLQTGDQYANALFKKYNNSIMPAFPNLTDAEIKEILNYIEY
ncbi:MAG: cytochrome c [Bacteroidetes bacterium]|nr:cytochrome c [Bacteroidota bacterium]